MDGLNSNLSCLYSSHLREDTWKRLLHGQNFPPVQSLVSKGSQANISAPFLEAFTFLSVSWEQNGASEPVTKLGF